MAEGTSVGPAEAGSVVGAVGAAGLGMPDGAVDGGVDGVAADGGAVVNGDDESVVSPHAATSMATPAAVAIDRTAT